MYVADLGIALLTVIGVGRKHRSTACIVALRHYYTYIYSERDVDIRNFRMCDNQMLKNVVYINIYKMSAP